jgi:FtsZ-binding cell division protein ZapB
MSTTLSNTKGIEVLALLRGIEKTTIRASAILEGEAGNPSNGLVTKVSRLFDEMDDLKSANEKLRQEKSKLENRVRSLEQWRWMLMGGATAMGAGSGWLATLIGG